MKILKKFSSFILEEYSSNGEEYEMKPIYIDLEDNASKLKRGTKYTWMGVEFVVKLNINMKKYYSIINPPSLTYGSVNDPYSPVVYSNSLKGLKEELKFIIPIYIEDDLGINLVDAQMKNDVIDMENDMGIDYEEINFNDKDE